MSQPLYLAKLHAPGSKKLLALDGGGIRGLITIEVLARLEALLKRVSGRGDFVLADYFDYIGGTSTGAVIGTLLSLGKSVDTIRNLYREFANVVFDGEPATRTMLKEAATNVAVNLLTKRFAGRSIPYAHYCEEHLAAKLREIVGGDDVTLCDNNLKTLLLIVMSNASTDSAWPVCNNPNAKYNDRNRPTTNANIPLWRLIRASTTAPIYFPAEEVEVGKKTHVFIDGGLTPYNNPAFQLFLQATLPPYRLCWQAGEKDMLVVSIGTGFTPSPKIDLRADDLTFLEMAMTAAAAQSNSAMYRQDLLCRVFGNCLIGGELDREVGDMNRMSVPGGKKLFTYLRYDTELTREGLDRLDKTALQDIDVAAIRELDSVAHMDDLQRVGACLASWVVEEHFAGFMPAKCEQGVKP